MTSKFFSLLGKVTYQDEFGQLAYQANGEFDTLRERWKIKDGEIEIGSVERYRFSPFRTWYVSGPIGEFSIRRHWLSYRRRYTILGGAFKGARIVGNVLDLRFSIKTDHHELASAELHAFRITDRYSINIRNPDAESTCIVAMLVLDCDRRRSFAGASSVPPAGQYTPDQ